MPPRKSKTNPRKRPRQERAQATVEAILQAAAYILVERGWEGFNTNRVAERAGVNIASLYQYFPSKEAIAAELQRRHIQHARASFPRALESLAAQRSLRAMLELLIRAAVAEHRTAPELHRVFTEELPRSARRALRAPGELETQWHQIMRPFVENVPEFELAAFVSRVCVHAVIHEAAVEKPELLQRPELIEEVVLLLHRYLKRPAARRRR